MQEKKKFFHYWFLSLFQRGLEEKLLNMKLKSSKIEELLPKRISNREQRDILTLLCKVHELELEKTEIQSAILCKENVLRTKDFIIQRHEQQRALCDDIIHQQKALIEGCGSLKWADVWKTDYSIWRLVNKHYIKYIYSFCPQIKDFVYLRNYKSFIHCTLVN